MSASRQGVQLVEGYYGRRPRLEGEEQTTWRLTVSGELGGIEETTRSHEGIRQSSICVLLRDNTRSDECECIRSNQEGELRTRISLAVERGKGRHTPHLESRSPYSALEREHRFSE